jgi:hypothetical protein
MRTFVTSPDFHATRLPAILTRLIEATERGEIDWETAAFPDSFAVTIGDVRFRVRSHDADMARPYVLEFLGQDPNPIAAPVIMTGDEMDDLDILVEGLYRAARQNVLGSTPDPFASVERALGLETQTSEN